MNMRTGSYTHQLMPYTTLHRFTELLETIRNRRIIFLCVLFSVAVHILFLLRFSGPEITPSMNTPISHSIELVLNKYTPEAIPQTKPKTIPVKRKSIKKKTSVEPVIAIPSEIQAAVTEQAPEETVTEEIIEDIPAVQSLPKNTPAVAALISSEKQQYLQVIAAHLDKHKYYPRSARRRHIEGDVKVSFELLEDGSILNLKIMAEHPVLQKATEESINSALPMPSRPVKLLALTAMTIEYSMQFTLN